MLRTFVGMRRYTVDQLSRVLHAHSPGRVLVLVPTHQIGRNLARWLTTEGEPFANVLFDTPLGTAKRLLESDTATSCPTFAERDDGLLAAAAAVESERKVPGFYFGSHVGHAFTGAAARTLQALDDIAASPEEVSRSAGRRGESLARLLSAYRRVQTETGRLSESATFRMAANREWPRPDYFAAVCVLDEVQISASAETFIRSISAAVRCRIGSDSFEHDAPARSACVVLADWRRADSDDRQDENRPSIRIASAYAPESEVTNVIADIVERDIPWDTCELVYTRSSYLPVIEAVCDALDVPVVFAEGRPATGAGCGQLLVGFFRWIAGGLRVADLETLLRTRALQFPGQHLGLENSVQPYSVAELLRTRRRFDGRAAYDYLTAPAGASDTRDRPQWEIDATVALAALLNLVPRAGQVSIGELAKRGVELLEHFGTKAGRPASAESRNAADMERAAMASLVERLRRVSDAHVEMSLESAASLLLVMIVDHRYGTSVSEGGHLYVVPLIAGGYSGRDHTFVIGLDEHTFPGTSSEDPLLLDDDRSALSSALPLARRQTGARLYALERILAVGGQSIALYSRGLDLIYGKRIELSPSVEALRERGGLVVDEMPLVESAQRAITITGRLLGQRRARDFADVTRTLFPWLKDGHDARDRRLAPSLSEYVGCLGRETPELSLRDGQPVSASRLETLATCPYRYFLRYVLRVRPPDDSDVEPGQWLNARELGTLLHDLYYRFMVELREAGERASFDRHEGRILELLDEIVAEQQALVPPPGRAALEADLMRMQRAARVFLREEDAAASMAEPVGFEVRFGRNADEEPLAVPLADDLVLGLSGSIDRVNRVGDAYEVWDYKTGSIRPFEGQSLRETSQHLQWMLYAYVYETLRAADGEQTSVNRSGYLFANDKEFGRRLAERVPGREELANDLRPLLTMVESGAFLHYHKSTRKTRGDKPGEACTFCDYVDVCWRERRSISDIDDLDVFDRESRVGRALTEWLTGK